MRSIRCVLFLVVMFFALAGPALACEWKLYGMYADGSLSDGYWWKPIRLVKSGEACRAMVKQATGRPAVGIIQWYQFPYKEEGAPSWLKEIMAAKPTGGREPWIGCLPADYDPTERR